MSSKKKQSHRKKKHPGDAKTHRRKKKLMGRWKPKSVPGGYQEFFIRPPKIVVPDYNKIVVPDYNKEELPWEEEDYLKMHFEALEKDIKLYKKPSEEYETRETLKPQIIRQFSELEEKISKAEIEAKLPAEKLEKYKASYESLKSELKEAGYDV